MRLTPAQAKKLAHLAAGHSLPRSAVPRHLLEPLLEAGAIGYARSGAAYRVHGNPGRLEAYIAREWGVRDLAALAAATPEARSRELLAEIASDSKALPSSPLEGILMRSFGANRLNEQPLGATPPGSSTLILTRELPQLIIDTGILIGIENPACLWAFEQTVHHFPEIVSASNYTLVLRWHWGSLWKEWLSRWSGRFFYFGDYDPAGLRIFASEVLPYQPTARLLVPNELGSLLALRGRRELYLRQEESLRKLPAHPDIDTVATLLKHHRKGLEQEILIHSLRAALPIGSQ